jgi:hypothetical protein
LANYLPWSHPDYDYLDYAPAEELLQQKGPSPHRTQEVLEVSFRAEGPDGVLLWVGEVHKTPSEGKEPHKVGTKSHLSFLSLALVDGRPSVALQTHPAGGRRPFVLTADVSNRRVPAVNRI